MLKVLIVAVGCCIFRQNGESVCPMLRTSQPFSVFQSTLEGLAASCYFVKLGCLSVGQVSSYFPLVYFL